ncbi:hypothetical protein N7466_011613 [Penicillium verhagenii]|uniref:uncharacterized protein n=1 Tax=Penicillium verhagenii TaxID=1562060 RepID=UPI0025459A7D|nr:uncharacterized protein N7466_011613 [Penicillium verhagenii]KAJ5915680.1 hypothetical protein N7466_011613 [Penicillium verhagenii]
MGAELPVSGPESIEVPLPDEQKSTKKTTEFLKNRVYIPGRVSPHPPLTPLPLRNFHQQTQRSLPDPGSPSNNINHHPRYLIPRGPLTIGTQCPNKDPSPSTDSQSSGNGSSSILSLPTPPVASFTRPHATTPQNTSTNQISCASPTSTVDLRSRTSIATEYLFRQSTTSSSVLHLSDIPPFPPPWCPPPSQIPPVPQDDPRLRAAGLVSPLKTSHDAIQEPPVSSFPQNSLNPRWTRVSLASSQAIPSSWGNDYQRHSSMSRDTNFEKGDNATIRTICKFHPASIFSNLDSPTLPHEQPPFNRDSTALATPSPPDASARNFVSSALSESEQDMHPKNPSMPRGNNTQKQDEEVFTESLEKEMDCLPRAFPTISDKKPNDLEPPRSDSRAGRSSRAHSTPLSLIDLIRSATEMASTVDHGRSTSRINLSAMSNHSEFRAASNSRRHSGSISDILSEFPQPGLSESKSRWFLPVSLWRSNRNADLEKYHVSSGTPAKKRFLGLSRRWLIIICVLILLIIVLAILLPVLLAAQSKDSSAKSCESTTPCKHGGVSVSSASGCSCICTNGYTGSQCAIVGDSSCVTSDLSESKNATMGSLLPSVFADSQTKFEIPLHEATIMALFSTNNVSCKTENTLVSFSGAESSSESRKSRRSIGLPIDGEKVGKVPNSEATNVASRSLASMEGIFYDDSDAKNTTVTNPLETESTTNTTILSEVMEFCQIAVLFFLEETSSLDSAVSAKESIQSYLVEYYASATSLEVLGMYDLDFENKTITLPNGTIIGG